MKRVSIYPDKFHGEWNYVIQPHRIRRSAV
jgi:hypothetical protein